MKKILIIRSVSLQLLDKQLPKILEYFGKENEYNLLTHAHSIERCKKYKGLREILKYENKRDFNLFGFPKDLKERYYDIVIIPFSNITGSGFLNVLLFSLRIKATSLYTINSRGKILKLNKVKIIRKTFFSLFNSIISVLSTIIVSPFLLIFFIINYLSTLKDN